MSTQVFVQLLLFALKGIPHVKYETKLLIMPVSLLFPQIGPNLSKILAQDHTHFVFCWFPIKYVRGFN